MGRLQSHVRNKMVAGALAAIPLAVTVFIVWYIDTKARALFGVRTPFLGVAITLGAIYGLGVFVSSLVGKFLIGVADALLRRIPGLGALYQSWKQIAVMSNGHDGIFARVVLVPDESGRMRMVGFSSGHPIDGDPNVCCVFVPASPNPTSGKLYFVAIDRCLTLDMTPRDALKLIISGGNYVPPAIGAATLLERPSK